jgi:hypothetical protein
MIYIAHRGLFDGPNSNLENSPVQIISAIERGFECEVDLHYVDNKLFLGHDEPQYEVDESWLSDKPLWIHAKNNDALEWLNIRNFNYFWHENDNHTLTSNGTIWTHPNAKVTTMSIMVMPEYFDKTLSHAFTANCKGICSDYVSLIRDKRDEINSMRR